jgi:acyl-CoA hydrolase
MTLVSNALSHDDTEGNVRHTIHPSPPNALVRELPSWVKEQMHSWGQPFCLPEWDDDDEAADEESIESYRLNHGWKVSLSSVLFGCSSPLQMFRLTIYCAYVFHV